MALNFWRDELDWGGEEGGGISVITRRGREKLRGKRSMVVGEE